MTEHGPGVVSVGVPGDVELLTGAAAGHVQLVTSPSTSGAGHAALAHLEILFLISGMNGPNKY